MRTRARKDGNHQAIVDGLRKAGVKVRVLNEKDLPDLICGWRMNLFLLEIKDGSRKPSERKLRPGQQKFADEWAGYPVCKVESLEQAFAALGIRVTT